MSKEGSVLNESASLYASIVEMSHNPDRPVHSEMITDMEAF